MNGKVKIHNKEYATVAYRVTLFRREYPKYQIKTELINQSNPVIIKAEISDEKEFLLASGYAEEDRTLGRINKTSAMENCETSAVGRALAFLGFMGETFNICSADEVENAISQQENKSNNISEKEDNKNRIKNRIKETCPDLAEARNICKSLFAIEIEKANLFQLEQILSNLKNKDKKRYLISK